MAASASSRPDQNRLLGIGLRIGATTCFAFMAAMIKLGYAAGVSTPELAFYRFAFGLPPLLIWIAWLGNYGAWRTERPLAHVSRAAIGLTTVLWFSLLSMLALSALLPFYARSHDAKTWVILLALGLFGGCGQLFLTSSLRYAPVSVVVPFDYTQLLWAVLLGWFIFANQPPATTWTGALVIIASGLYTVYREHKLGREKPRAAPPL
jgi:drug/metabolite transporter (DMT)-like permease